jgi:hypothetical protein
MRRTIAVLPLLIAFATMALAHGNEEHVMGTINAIAEHSITVNTTTGKITEVAVTEKTTFRRGGQQIEPKDIKVGDRVVIHAKKNGDRLEATTVRLSKSGQRTGAANQTGMHHEQIMHS